MSDAVPGRLRSPTAVSSIQGAWLVGLLAAVLVLLYFTGGAGRQLLRYERAAVLHGEYWRLLTGHLAPRPYSDADGPSPGDWPHLGALIARCRPTPPRGEGKHRGGLLRQG